MLILMIISIVIVNVRLGVAEIVEGFRASGFLGFRVLEFRV